jgi:hypothetical protein
MTRLTLFIGPSETAAARLRAILKEKAAPLLKRGVLAPDWNHVRLYAACADPEEIGVLRVRRGLDNTLVGSTLVAEFEDLIPKDLAESDADHVVVSAAQLGSLYTDPAEVARLRDLLAPFFDDIRIVAMVEEQARMLVPQFTYAVTEGRDTGLAAELALAGGADWWRGALVLRGANDPHLGIFNDVRHPAPWLDFTALLALWEDAFGRGKVTLMPLEATALGSDRGTAVVERMLDLDKPLGTVAPETEARPEAAVNLARMRIFNEALIRLCRVRDVICPRDLWRDMLASLRIPGPAIAPGSLFALSDHFRAANAALVARFPDLGVALEPDAPLPAYREPDPQYGFRATQYLAAYDYHLRRQGIPIAQKRAEAAAAEKAAEKFDGLLAPQAADRDDEEARARLLNRVKVNHRVVLSTQFRPHNRLGTVNEEAPGAAYAPAAPRRLEPGSTGRVIVGCMKNEAPYILEWIAYHRAIGVDNFLIYTNGCTDGTDAVLDRLMEMGVVQHRNNDDWKGNSPQQHALNRSLKEPLIRDAEWIIHIDVDEFMNIRTGNGTLDDLFAAVPDATNFAMTWRLFGHNGVTELRDAFVIDQFDTCAPSFCPKPHTVWGFKTMFRNIGAYAKVSCHRPNKLAEGFEDRVKWVNGSGRDMTRDALHNGWRSSRSNVGYDLLQLNHYALRSAESFLIKRQRGRALHVDRSIGLNYWIRMDWSDVRDITIKRNLPRLRAEYDRLMADDTLRARHEAGLAWHRAKAAELRAEPEFADLYRQALEVRLNETERVAYALSLDMES